MGRIKSIDKLYDDLQEDANKISKEFNQQVADEFKRVYIEEAYNWYNENSQESEEYYIRTGQLGDKALLIKKEETYGQKISFSADKIRPERHTDGKLPSYYSFNKKVRKNIASDVLYWEEMGYNNFAKYGYRKGQGVWGRTVNEMIKQIDKIRPDKGLKVKLPDNIINDLYNLLKNKTKTILQKRWVEMFYG